ncbi:MAG: hypothetical protein Kow0099_33320 [Candidatus Abyssubacteria bacterium]
MVSHMRSVLFDNLQVRVMLLFLLISLVPLGVVGAFSVRTAEELIMNLVSNHLENVADDKAALLERWISERSSDLEVIAGSSILKSLDPALIAQYLELVEKKYMVYRGFVIFSPGGKAIFNSFGKKVTPLQEESFNRSIQGETYISNIVSDPERNESIFCVSAPIFGNDNRVMGVACAVVGTHPITSMILKVSLGETGECYLVDKTGTFLAHKDPQRILTDNISQTESFRNIFGQDRRRRIYTDYRGIEVLGASRQVSDLDWYLVVEQDRDEAFLVADRLERYVYLVVVLSVLGSAALAWLLSYHVVNPIRTLSQAAHEFAAGKFGLGLEKTNRVDEIGVLHNAFRDMAMQLEARQHRLEERMELTEAELKETDVKLRKTMVAAARSEQLAALGRLAAGVTHEIRTPVTSLKLFLESVRAEIEISPEYEQDFKVAMNQIRRMEATISRFLDFAKPQEPIFSIVEVPPLIDEALLMVKPKANQQETLVTVAAENHLPRIQGDRKQLAEVLVNLMVNALEAMANRGTLRVAANNDHFEISGRLQPCIRIDVSDTGPGIAPENMARLFAPFFTTKASGTGLGLSIAHSTVSKHGGQIKVESDGRGTTFSIFLPAFTEDGNEEYGKNIDS